MPVDHHQHLFRPETLDLVTAGSSGDRTRFDPIVGGDLVRLLDVAGMARALVLSLAYTWGSPDRQVEDEYVKVRAENDWTSRQVTEFPDRLRAFLSFNPLRDYALDELNRCAADPNLKRGLKLHFGNSLVDLHNRGHVGKLQRLFESANSLGMAIAVHMRASVSHGLPYGADEARIFLNELLPAAPAVLVQVAHLAGAGDYSDPPVDGALAVLAEAVEVADPRAGRLWFDVSGVAGSALGTPVPNADLLVRRLRQIGTGRILFGSDAATGGNLAPREAWRRFRELSLKEQEFAAIAQNVAPYAA